MPFQAIASAPVAAGAAIGRTVPTAVRPLEGDLEGHHPAERAAGDEGEAPDPQRVEERPLGPGLVARGDGREGRPVGLPGPRVDIGRPGRAVAAAEQVGAEDADPGRVEGPPRPDERRPPVAGRVGAAGEGVDDEDLGRLGGPRAVVAIGDAERREDRPVTEG